MARAPGFDYSRHATYETSDAKVAVVTRDGVVIPRGNGAVQIRATFGKHTAAANAVVNDFAIEAPVSFRNQVVPILTKHGCNSGGCHGKQLGQNNFKLSLLGFDPDFDFNALVKEARGRRLTPAAPDNSLLAAQGHRGCPARRRQTHEARQLRIRIAAPLGSARHTQGFRQRSARRRASNALRKVASSASRRANNCWSPRSTRMAAPATSPTKPNSRATNWSWSASMTPA